MTVMQCILLLSAIHSIQAVSRKATINSALHLECRHNHTIQINGVILGSDDPSCSHSLSPPDSDYIRVVDECSGRKSCANIVLQESTKIPCTSIGLLDSEYMIVNYTCIPAYNVLSVCHNTVRAVSPFEGYLSTPGYPSVIPQAINDGVVCNCQISSLASDVPVQLLVVDMVSSEQVKVMGPSMSSRYICGKTRTTRCINTLSTFYDSTVNITFQPDLLHPIKFILQYRAEGRLSRVQAICSMSLTSPLISNKTLLSPAVNSSKTPRTEPLRKEVLRLEIIAAICAAILLLLICVIVAAIARRRCQNSRKNLTGRRHVFRALASGNDSEFEIGSDNAKKCKSTRRGREASKAGSEHTYQELTKYIAGDRRRSVTAGQGEATAVDADYYNAADVTGSGIYESIEYLEEDSGHSQSRLSDMKKAGSMPLHPAPPLPRDAVMPRNQSKHSKRFSPASNSNKSAGSSSIPPIVRNSTAEFLTETLANDSSSAKLPSHTSEICLRQMCRSPSDTCSVDFNPQLDIDLSDLLIETEKKFEQRLHSCGSEPEYMEPAKLFTFNDSAYQLVENELYLSEK